MLKILHISISCQGWSTLSFNTLSILPERPFPLHCITPVVYEAKKWPRSCPDKYQSTFPPVSEICDIPDTHLISPKPLALGIFNLELSLLFPSSCTQLGSYLSSTVWVFYTLASLLVRGGFEQGSAPRNHYLKL